MKTRQTLIRLFVVIFIAMLFHGCQKDFDLLDHPSVEVQGEASVLEKAKEWYQNNMRHTEEASDLDVRLLTPDWDSYVLSENAAGQPWISIPLKNQEHTDVFLTEISLVIDRKGRANGIIKEYKDDPYIGDSELTIYTGSGKLYEKGMYRHKRRSLFVNRRGVYLSGKDKLYRIAYGQKLAMERTSLNFFKTASGSGGGDGAETSWEIEIEEVIVPPPPGGSGPNPWEDPWEGYDPWENGSGGGEGEGGGGSSGGGSGSGGGNGDGGVPSAPVPNTTTVVAPRITINLTARLNCFATVPSNSNTIYNVTLHVDRTTNYLSNPGHAFITLEKSNGSSLQRLSYGFYPETNNILTIGLSRPINSAIGEESGDPDRESEIRYTVSVGASAFQNAINRSLSLVSNDYDLNDYNCTNYALDVFNTVLGTGSQLNGVSTPNGLYSLLNGMSNTGIHKDKIEGKHLPPSTNCN